MKNKAVSEYLSRIGKRGGKARKKALTQKERSAIARMGAEATNAKRWGAKRKKKAKKSLDRQAKDADSPGHAARVTAA